MRRHGFDRPPVESVYFPIASLDGAPVFAPPRPTRLIVQARSGNALPVIPRLRSIVAAADPSVPIANVKTMDAS